MTTTADKSAKLSDLQEQQAALVLESQIHVLETRLRHAQEQDRMILEGWGDLIDPLDGLRSEPDFFGGIRGARQDRADNRKDGDNGPHFTDEQQLAFIRGAGQWIAETDPAGINIVETLTSYAIGTGMSHEVNPKPDMGEVGEAAAVACQAVVDEFLERVEWKGSLDAELFRRTRKAGERFVRVKDIGGGYSEVDVCEPSWITEPLNAREIEDHLGLFGLNWKYGVATPPGRPLQVVGYFNMRYGDSKDWEFIPVEEMSHVKVNVDRGVKRGLSDFYGGSEEWLTDSRKALRNIVKQAAIQAAISLIRKHKPGTTNAQIQGMADGIVEFQTKLPPLYGEGGSRNIPTERWYPGKIVDERGFDTMYGPMGTPQGPNLVMVVDAGLRMAGRRWGFPEDMISGNASNNNYASILEAHTPFTIAMKRCQVAESSADRDVLWKVVGNACKAGRLPYQCDQLKQLVTIDVEPPDIEVRDQQKDHTVRKEQHEAGMLSMRTWAEKEGLDYDKEQENIAVEPQKPQPMVDPLTGLPVQQPLAPPQFGDPNAQPQYEARLESLRARALESLLEETDSGDRWVTLDNGVKIKLDGDGSIDDEIATLRGRSGKGDRSAGREPWQMSKEEFNKSFWFHGRSGSAKQGDIHGGVAENIRDAVKYTGITSGDTSGNIALVRAEDVEGIRQSTTGDGSKIIDRVPFPLKPFAVMPVTAADNPHKYFVQQAIKNGKKVTAEVLDLYPDLKK